MKYMEDYATLVWGEYNWLELCREIYAEQGVYWLGPVIAGSQMLWTTTPVRTPEDFKGKKVRALGSQIPIYQSMGAAPTSMPTTEGYTALQLGTLDGWTSALTLYKDMKHYEVAPYLCLPPIVGVVLSEHLVNPDSWAALPDDLKMILAVSSDLQFWEIGQFAERPWYTNDFNDALTYIKNTGAKFEIVETSPEFQAAITNGGLAVMEDVAKKSARCARMVDDIKAVMKVQGYIK